jgi:uncharacterized membrane protein YagU involved in acid resistance
MRGIIIMKIGNTAPPPTGLRPRNALPMILRIGLIAGTLDITDALVFSGLHGVRPGRVFQYIASGLIGIRSFQGGMASVVLGVALHYLIALIWTAIFYVASRQLAILTRRPVISGLLYGVVVYLIMNLIVLPLSGVPHSPRAISLASRINGVLALMLCIGLTISLLVRKTTVPA